MLGELPWRVGRKVIIVRTCVDPSRRKYILGRDITLESISPVNMHLRDDDDHTDENRKNL